MIKQFAFILFVLIHSSCKQKQQDALLKVPESALELHKHSGSFLLHGEAFTGSSFKNYPNGKISRVINYFEGQKHGKMILFFKSGDTSYIANYLNGRLNGKITGWWNNGKLRSERNYLDGKVHGEQKQWYKSGAKFKRLHYKNGIENGMQQEWTEDGKLYNNYENRNGRIYGLKRSNLCFELEDEEIQF